MLRQKIEQSNSILNSLRRALRPIPFWVGYKREKYWHHDVPEAAIVAELRETLLSSVAPNLRVECEVAYSKFDPQTKRKRSSSHSQLADLAISSTEKRSLKKKYLARSETWQDGKRPQTRHCEVTSNTDARQPLDAEICDSRDRGRAPVYRDYRERQCTKETGN